MSNNVHTFSMKRIDGKDTSLGDYRGKVLLVVNVASKCGLTPQYEALEKLYEAKRERGLEVLGFPANDFEGQEPGTDAEIASFCSTKYDVKFPLFSKISVVGANKHPLYQHLTTEKREATGEGPMRKNLAGYGIATSAPGEVLWNFEKFLVDRQGKVINRFAPDVTPDDPRLTSAIESALAAK
ncbi:MAG: glutathione peroxidase [Deltaproteobacteria bacterium]|nr:glutathione peroxidase [Deltaproteobacteria bacterium]